jgi:hypothetical protein
MVMLVSGLFADREVRRLNHEWLWASVLVSELPAPARR